MEKSAQGFTLIELLITISIISILSVVGLVLYSAVLSQVRDNKRQSDLNSIQQALEQYYADQGFYPASLTFGSGNSLTNTTGNPNSVSGAKTYLNNVPADPKPSPQPNYCYTPSDSTCDNTATGTKCLSYILNAKLETGSGSTAGTCSGYNYTATPP